MRQLKNGCPERPTEEPTRLQEPEPLSGEELADINEL